MEEDDLLVAHEVSRLLYSVQLELYTVQCWRRVTDQTGPTVPTKTAPPGAVRRPDRRGRTRRRGPGERAGLAREVVLDAARSISAREGLAHLTMRRLAARLGVAPNALYSHFADKSALVDELVDAVLAEVPLTPDDTDWRSGLVRLMTDSRRLLLAHTELIPLVLARAARGPNALRLGEATLALIRRG